MKKLLLALTSAVLVASLAGADALRTKLEIPYGTVLTDTLKWRASGSVPGTGPLKVDTMVAGTLNDTSLPIDIWGAESVLVTILTRSKNDDMDLTFTAQVSPVSDTAGLWMSLATTYSVDNTKGAQVSGTANTGRDTTNWILNSDYLSILPDTSAATALAANNTLASAATSATHRLITWSEFADRTLVRSSRFLRLWWDPDSASGDTTYITAIYTIIYPPAP